MRALREDPRREGGAVGADLQPPARRRVLSVDACVRPAVLTGIGVSRRLVPLALAGRGLS